MSRSHLTRWSLVLGAARGENERREDFARQYANVIASYFAARWRLPIDHERVGDATQDVFVQCFKDGGALERVEPDRPGGFRAYLFGVASNVSLMMERRFARLRKSERGESVVDLAHVEQDAATLSQTFDRAWAAMIAREARRLLAERAMDDERAAERFRCLEMQYSGGLPPRTIAARLGIPATQVYERLREARIAFRAALLEVLREQSPGSTRAELEESCKELAGLL